MPFDALGNYIEGEEEPSIDQMRYEMSQKSIPETIRQAVQSPANRLPTYQNIADIGSGFASAGESLVRGAGSAMLGGIGDVLQGLQHSPLIPTVTDKLTLNDYLPGIEGLMPKTEQTYELPVKQHRNMSYPQARPKQEFMGIPYATSNDVLEAMPQRYTPKFGDEEANTFMENLGKNLMIAGVPVVKREIIEGLELAGRIPNMTKEGAEAFARDYANAMHGVYPETPTAGSRAADFVKATKAGAEDFGGVMARRSARDLSPIPGVPKGVVEVMDPRMFAVRNTGQGQMIRPQATSAGMEPNAVDYGETEALLKEIAPPLESSRPQDIIDAYEQHYMSDNSPATRQLNFDWDNYQRDMIKKLYPDFQQTDAFKAFRAGYPPNVIADMKLKWFHDFVAQEKAKGAPIPTMEEFFGRAQAANTLTKKIIPNIIQKYIGTPNDPFLEMAKKGVTMNPADELVSKYSTTTDYIRGVREEAGFAREGEVADKLMPVAESKLATQTSELDNLIAEQAEIGRTEGMMVPYPDGRIDPETGQVAMATNPNYAKYTNKIGALRKAIEDTQEEIRNLQIAKAYENVVDASIRMAPAFEWRNRIPPAEQQFHPAIFGEKPRLTPEAEREFKTPAEAPFFEANVAGLKQAGILPLTKDLIGQIMSGKIPPEQVPTLSQPHTITKFMADIVAPRLEKEKAARLAQVNYKQNVEKHFQDVLSNPAMLPLTDNTKLLWLDDGYSADFIQQALSDETFVLDHCIGQAGNGRGLKNLYTGDERQYIPYLDPVTGNPFQGASGTSSYMDRIEAGELDVMSIRDAKTGLPVGTIELNKTEDIDTGEPSYDIGYVSGYKNRAIKPEYRQALRDALNKVKDSVKSSDGNENKSGVYDMRDRDQMNTLFRDVKNKLPSSNQTETFKKITKEIQDTMDGDRYATIDQIEQAIEDYKKANPPVPAVRQPAPAGQDIAERNIVMQGLSRENLNTSRQFDAARIVADNNLFTNLPSTTRMEEGPRLALQTILRGQQRRAREPVSDYELFRNLQTYVDQINDGSLRFGDFGLNSASDLLELRDGLQRHADAVGQLAHYADVLQRNGFRSPLPSETLNSPDWQAYQRFMGELAIDNPNDLRTRLRDMIQHGDPRELDANLDAIQVENFKHLLEIHDRAIKQAVDYPAPTAPEQQRGIPIQQWEQLIQNGMNEIQRMYGNQTRDVVANIMVDAIRSQMDTAVNERPVQVSNFLSNTAGDTTLPLEVRTALRNLAGQIDQANADIQNARNAPQTPALPSVNDLTGAINRGLRTTPTHAVSSEVMQNYDEISDAMTRNGQLAWQNPVTLANQLTERGNYLIGEGEPDVGNGLLAIAREVSQLVPANPPASMALANQNARSQVLYNSILDAMNDAPNLAPTISDRLNRLEWRQNLVDNPLGLIRNIRIEAEAEAQVGNEQLASAFYDIANLIADENNVTMFTPAQRQAGAPTATPRDIAETASAPAHQSLTQRVAQVDALTNAINEEIRSIPTAPAELRQAELFYSDPNNLPASIIDHTHDFADAERIANYLLQHVHSRMVNRPEGRMDFDTALNRVADEIRNTYTGNYLQQFQDGDVDVRSTVLQDVADRPSVYGMARATPEIQRQVVEHLRTQGMPQGQAQLPAPAPQVDLENTGRIFGTIHNRMMSVNREHLGVSQQFDNIVRATINEFDPVRNTIDFIQSLHHRANSVDRHGDREAMILANQLRHLAADVNDVLHVPARDQEAEHHWRRVELGTNQPAGLGALTRDDSEMVRRIATNEIAGAHQNIGAAMPSQRDMASILIGSGEATGNAMPAVEHTRLINTLTSQTYNPATDGEALIRLLEQRAGMFANLEAFQSQEGIRIVNDWNRLRFPNYRPPEEGMGLEPEGHKRGGAIRKKVSMNEGGDAAEEARKQIRDWLNKPNPNAPAEPRTYQERLEEHYESGRLKRPTPPTNNTAPRSGGGSGFAPSGSQPWSPMDRPHLYNIGGKVYMEIGGQVKPVPNIPSVPEKTNPNTTDHVIKRPTDSGFKEVLERVRNTPKPSGGAGTIPSGSGTTLLDRPHLYARGGRIHMNDGGLPETAQSWDTGSLGHSGIDPRQDTKTPAEYARSGLPEVTGDPYDVWETKYQLNQATRDKLNFNDPAYTLGIKEVRVSTPMDESWGGFHSSDEPDVVHIKNIHANPMHYSQTLTHEGQHLQDYKTDQNKFKPRGNLDAIEYLYKTGNQYLNQREIENNYQAYKDKWIAEHPNQMPYDKLGAYWNMDAPWAERIADLNSLEGQLKRGERFADTEMGKAILPTPELQNYYYQSVRPMEAKAVAYEPTVFDRIRNATRNFQEKVSSGKSYADSAYESAKEFKDGGDVNIDAMRLALTKG